MEKLNYDSICRDNRFDIYINFDFLTAMWTCEVMFCPTQAPDSGPSRQIVFLEQEFEISIIMRRLKRFLRR